MNVFRHPVLPAATALLMLLNSDARANPAASTAGPASSGNGKSIAEVIFTETPVENGMTFDRKGASPVTLPAKSGPEQAWQVEHYNGPGHGHHRTFFFDITDPATAAPDRGSIDIEVTYQLNAWGGVDVRVNKDDGPAAVANLWGLCEGRWKTATVRVDQARLNNGLPGGFDLQLAGSNGPLLLKSVRVVSYDPRENVDWQRLMKVSAATPVGSVADPVFVFRRGTPVGLRYEIENLAKVAATMRYQLKVINEAGEQVFQESGPAKPISQGQNPLELKFATDGWALGPYIAQIDLLRVEDGKETPAFSFETKFGLINETKLGKRRPGEFAFGLDPGSKPRSPEALAFFDIMGVDLLRDPGVVSHDLDPDAAIAAVNELTKVGVYTALVIDPPGQMRVITEEERLQQLATLVPRIEKVASALKGKVTYFELGNEPDLTFFYPGTTTSYLASFSAMSDAVKRGNPDALVMNGGLCFFGVDGDRRAREIIEHMDMSKLDVWAYHGHGVGVEAERAAYDRQIEATAKFGKNTRPLLDTETGLHADTPNQIREQSRTGVQKMVFAHAKGMPSLFWFRMFMGNDTYTMTFDRVQPRPTILSYRAMVERLRHVKFARMLETDTPELEVYLFDEIDENQKPTGTKTLVAWSNSEGRSNLTLKLDEDPATIQNATIYDLYGNPTPAAHSGGIVSMTVGIDPVYLSWKSDGSMSEVGTAPPALKAASIPLFVPRGKNDTMWLLKNSGPTPLTVTLKTSARSSIPVTVETPEITRTLAPDSQEAVHVNVVTDGSLPIDLPHWWTVFTDVDEKKIDAMTPQDFATIPTTLPGESGTASPQRVWTTDGMIDLGILSKGAPRERKPAVLYTTIDSPSDSILTIGSAADWWMKWYVNGREVYSTFADGNDGSMSPDTHQFKLPLVKGANVIAVHVLSGTAGFRLVFGGERDIQTALAGGIPPDRLDATLISDGQILAEQSIPIRFQSPVPSYAHIERNAPLDQWLAVAPAAVANEDSVKNLHEAFPDKSRWYGGRDDLSAIAWVRDRSNALDVVVAVRDDTHVPAPAGTQAAGEIPFDALRIKIPSNTSDKPETEIVLTDTPDGPVIISNDGSTAATLDATVELLSAPPDGFSRIYRLTLPANSPTPSQLAITVDDADDNILKQTLTFQPIPCGIKR